MKTINEIKESILKFVGLQVKCNVSRNSIYENMSNDVWKEELLPYIKNEEIQGWEKDIKKKFLDNPYVKFQMSEKQAYCLARAFQAINAETISLN